MKSIVIFMGFFLALVLAEEVCPFGKAVSQYFEACATELKTPEDVIELVKKCEGQEKEEVQCFWACLIKKADVMQDAKIQFDKLEEVMKKDTGADLKRIEEIVEGFKSCKDEAEISDNTCNVAGKYLMCLSPKLFPKP
ncbi:uncharacterized protein [Venturia canescens]|uniref:uncharacterized protein n=1 Tax=Venturia canescens TaxID=32260 RepID=UPI001C9D163A|nr:uncharacterized protein LOC122416006 [Venturia canescens]